MKKHILTLLVLTSFISYGQEISKEDFQSVIKSTYGIIDMLKKSNLEGLEAFLRLSTEEAERLKSVDSKALNDRSVFTTPHYFLTDTPNVFQMVIVSFKTADKLPNESFNRGKYFIVIKSLVKLDVKNKAILFSDSEILTTSDQINAWWSAQYKTYVPKTAEVYKLFEYLPPPPSPPPLGLK